MLFTLVDPHRGYEQRYHRWYERDHFYSNCLTGPGLFAGRRFVAPWVLKTARFGDARAWGRPLHAGSFLAVYWIEDGRHDEYLDWSSRRTDELGRSGRLFQERDHVHTQLYQRAGCVSRDADPVPLELALDHPFAGLAVIAGREGAPRPMPAGGPIAVSSVWVPAPARQDQPDLLARQAMELSLLFLDETPADAWDEVRAATEERAVVWAAGFVPTVPGTDRYVDELWDPREE